MQASCGDGGAVRGPWPRAVPTARGMPFLLGALTGPQRAVPGSQGSAMGFGCFPRRQRICGAMLLLSYGGLELGASAKASAGAEALTSLETELGLGPGIEVEPELEHELPPPPLFYDHKKSRMGIGIGL